jgi:hypothetical protein
VRTGEGERKRRRSEKKGRRKPGEETRKRTVGEGTSVELAVDHLEVGGLANASSAAAESLVSPVEGPHLTVGVTARSAAGLLDVERVLAAAGAAAVELSVALALRRGTLSHG